MQFVAVEGKGNPNDVSGDYAKAMQVLYGIQFTIKMSKMGNHKLNGYFDYVVPPLEGLWWFDGNEKIVTDKSRYNWISMIRLPEFVNHDIFQWACSEVTSKKNIETANAKFLKINEGLCVQCMHIGSYDDESRTINLIEDFIGTNNLVNDITDTRKHHEIYLSDPRKTAVEKLRTVIRIHVKTYCI
jgi:hypothetical protein